MTETVSTTTTSSSSSSSEQLAPELSGVDLARVALRAARSARGREGPR